MPVAPGNLVVLNDDTGTGRRCAALVLGLRGTGPAREPFLDLVTVCDDIDRAGPNAASTLELAGVPYGPGQPGCWAYPEPLLLALNFASLSLPVGPATSPASMRISRVLPTGVTARGSLPPAPGLLETASNWVRGLFGGNGET